MPAKNPKKCGQEPAIIERLVVIVLGPLSIGNPFCKSQIITTVGSFDRREDMVALIGKQSVAQNNSQNKGNCTDYIE